MLAFVLLQHRISTDVNTSNLPCYLHKNRKPCEPREELREVYATQVRRKHLPCLQDAFVRLGRGRSRLPVLGHHAAGDAHRAHDDDDAQVHQSLELVRPDGEVARQVARSGEVGCHARNEVDAARPGGRLGLLAGIALVDHERAEARLHWLDGNVQQQEEERDREL